MSLKEIQGLQDITLKNAWKLARTGVIIFACIHFIYEILIENKSGIYITFINFALSAWWIKRQVKTSKGENSILYGFSISSFVYLCQFFIGAIISYLIYK
jgi:hypothetical protein